MTCVLGPLHKCGLSNYNANQSELKWISESLSLMELIAT